MLGPSYVCRANSGISHGARILGWARSLTSLGASGSDVGEGLNFGDGSSRVVQHRLRYPARSPSNERPAQPELARPCLGTMPKERPFGPSGQPLVYDIWARTQTATLRSRMVQTFGRWHGLSSIVGSCVSLAPIRNPIWGLEANLGKILGRPSFELGEHPHSPPPPIRRIIVSRGIGHRAPSCRIFCILRRCPAVFPLAHPHPFDFVPLAELGRQKVGRHLRRCFFAVGRRRPVAGRGRLRQSRGAGADDVRNSVGA